MIEIESERFGLVEVESERIIDFPEGLPGFPDNKRYFMIDKEDSAFIWFHNVEDSQLAFVVMDPWVAFPDYEPEIPDEDVEFLEIKEPADILFLCIATVPENPKETTLNLLGPLVINTKNKKAKQILVMGDYGTKHKIFQPAGSEAVVGEVK